MPDYQKNPLYLHPLLHSALPGILKAVTDALPAKWKATTGAKGIHRTPNEQFEIYKEGRTFKNGKWVVTGEIHTKIDGFSRLSRHNYLPANAVDIVLIQPNGKELEAGPQENQIKKGAVLYGFEWGGDFQGDFQDRPHIQLPTSKLYSKSLQMDTALQWQKYLFHGKFLTGETQLDGRWGDTSRSALLKAVGTTERSPDAWLKLYTTFGPLEDLTDFDHIPSIPKVKV